MVNITSNKSVTSTAYHSHTHPHDRSHNPPQAIVLVQYDSKHVMRASIPDDPFEENIYNLIPMELAPTEKTLRYRSKFAGMARREYKAGIKPAASMGPAKVVVNPPSKFLKKSQLKNPSVSAAVSSKHQSGKTANKASLPKELGVRNEKTQKDFIKMNALENIHSIPKKIPHFESRYIAKKDFGSVPEYLKQRKVEQQDFLERRAHDEIERRREEVMRSGFIPLPEEERVEILDGLKSNWAKFNLDYMKLSLTVDTVPKINRKVSLENSLKKLEEDIQKFSHSNILVDFNSYARLTA